MKLKFKLLILLVAITGFVAQAKEYTENVHAGFDRTQITALDVANKFGSIEINDWGGDSVTVDVNITVESISENNAMSMIDLIEIEIYKSGGTVHAKTVIDDSFKTTQNFSIDYVVNIPKSCNLSIDNKFGDLILNELTGNGNFEISYGNVTAGTINSTLPVKLDLSYGKTDIGIINQLSAEIKYSKIYLGTAESIDLDSKYSSLNIEVLKTLNLESKYDDISVEMANNITADSKYSNYEIERLGGSFILDTEYGTVDIDEVSNSFTNIDITNSYGSINIGMNDLSYQLNAECNYCDINFNEKSFKGNHSSDIGKESVNGTIGSNSANKQVKLNSKYGNIKL